MPNGVILLANSKITLESDCSVTRWDYSSLGSQTLMRRKPSWAPAKNCSALLFWLLWQSSSSGSAISHQPGRMVAMIAEMAGATDIPGDAPVEIRGITVAVITTVFAAETGAPATGSATTTGPATDGPTITGDTAAGGPVWHTAKTIAIPVTAEGSGNPDFKSI